MKPFDPVEYMCDEEGIAAFLNEAAVLANGNQDVLLQCVKDASQARSINQLAEATGIDRQKLYEMFSGSKPDPTMIAKVQAVFVSCPKTKELVHA